MRGGSERNMFELRQEVHLGSGKKSFGRSGKWKTGDRTLRSTGSDAILLNRFS